MITFQDDEIQCELQDKHLVNESARRWDMDGYFVMI